MLQELHKEYEAGHLKKCLLSMYLKLTLNHRETLIEELKKFRDGKLEQPPKIPRRLAKLPAWLKVLADRGFDGDSLSYPHFNTVVTPEFYDKESKQFDLAQLERDRKICELRYTCEVVFSRVTTERLLAGIIPYSAFAHIEDAHCWAHAQANLRQPLQPPGSRAASILGEDYFSDKEKEESFHSTSHLQVYKDVESDQHVMANDSAKCVGSKSDAFLPLDKAS